MDPTNSPADGRRILSSWKEIGAYLNMSVRTAQLWERERGLPVHRREGERGRVWADVAELEQWRAARSGEAPAVVESRRPGYLWMAIAGCVILAAAFGLAWRVIPRQPARWRVDRETLIVSDAEGRECWQRQFERALDVHTYEVRRRLGWIGDLDGDGSTDVLFAAFYADAGKYGSELYCFSQRGRLKWRYRPGRKLMDGQNSPLSDQYGIFDIGVFTARSGAKKVVFIANEALYYPAQVGVLSASGQLEGEYFHSGVFQQVEISDLDGDGVQDLVLVGTANGYRGPALVVLDSDKVFGASEEQPKYKLAGLGPAQEKLRIVFPQTCLNRRFESRSGINAVDVRPDQIGVIAADLSGAALFYHLARNGRLLALVVGDSYRERHARAFAEGKLDHEFNAAEEAELRQVRYLRGPM